MKENIKSQEVNEQIEFGLENIDDERVIEMKLKDFIHLYKAIEEFRRFFHQRMHYPTIEDVNIYIGNKNFGAFSVLNKMYCKVLDQYLPKDIEELIDDNKFQNPKYPYYYKVKNDESIEDGTLKVIDKATFSIFVEEMLKELKKENMNWENSKTENYIESIVSYSEKIDGYYQNMNFTTSAETPTWRIFAQILKGASIYE
jgi:hypothetical protein